MDAEACGAYFSDSVGLDGDELRVYRCDWGWCVKRGEAAGRSRFLDEAFELALGRRLDGAATRALIEMLDRELTARRAAEGKTAVRVVRLPGESAAA